MAKVYEHEDKLGVPLVVGDYVAFPDGNHLGIGVVKSLSPKMISVHELGLKQYYAWYNGVRKYPRDLVKLESAAATFYVLKNT